MNDEQIAAEILSHLNQLDKLAKPLESVHREYLRLVESIQRAVLSQKDQLARKLLEKFDACFQRYTTIDKQFRAHSQAVNKLIKSWKPSDAATWGATRDALLALRIRHRDSGNAMVKEYNHTVMLMNFLREYLEQ